jgi:predicted nucleic acid-binding protein
MVVPAFFVADASFTLPWAFSDEGNALTDEAWKALRNDATTIHVPAIWMWEFANGLFMGEKRGRISREAIDQCVSVVTEAQIRVVSELPRSVFSELPGYIRSHGLTSYDAAYLALAVRHALPLATFDKALAKAALAEGVEVLS